MSRINGSDSVQFPDYQGNLDARTLLAAQAFQYPQHSRPLDHLAQMSGHQSSKGYLPPFELQHDQAHNHTLAHRRTETVGTVQRNPMLRKMVADAIARRTGHQPSSRAVDYMMHELNTHANRSFGQNQQQVKSLSYRGDMASNHRYTGRLPASEHAQTQQSRRMQSESSQPARNEYPHPFSAEQIAADAHSDPHAVKQAPGYHDCWQEATVIGMAHSEQGRRKLAQMIQQNPNGDYVVTLPGDRNHPQVIRKSEIPTYNTADGKNWAKIIAIAVIKNDPDHAGMTGHGAPLDYATKLLTGDSALVRQTNKESTAGIAHEMSAALARGEVVTTSKNFSDGRNHLSISSSQSIMSHHVYAVDSVSQAPDGTSRISLINPHGMNNGTAIPNKGDIAQGVRNDGDGRISMSMDTYHRLFSHYSIEQA